MTTDFFLVGNKETTVSESIPLKVLKNRKMSTSNSIPRENILKKWTWGNGRVKWLGNVLPQKTTKKTKTITLVFWQSTKNNWEEFIHKKLLTFVLKQQKSMTFWHGTIFFSIIQLVGGKSSPIKCKMIKIP